MSLVQGIITDDFALVGAETCATKQNGTTIDGFNKMIKLNKSIIFGCTGGIKDNFQLFQGFCNYSDESGLVPINTEFIISYNEFVNIISRRFIKMCRLKHNTNNPVSYEIISMICGYNGKEFEITSFNTNSQEQIIKATKPVDFPYKGANAGKTEHLTELQKLVQETYFEYGYVTLTQYKSILREVFRKGAKIDKGINDDVHFEIIKKKDVI